MKRLLLLITICISSLSFGQVPNYVPTNGLVGWWGFNGNANDESGNGNNGTVNGATLTTDRFGNANSAYDFDGLNDNINVNWTFNVEERSFFVWFKSDASTGLLQMILGNDNVTTTLGGTQIAFKADSTIAVVSGNFNTPCIHQGSFGTWYFAGVVRDSLLTRVYINGELMCTDQNDNIHSYLGGPNGMHFGSTSNTPDRWFDGVIDDIGIWNRALTACEISALYNAQVANLSVNAGLDASICNGNELALSATANSGSTQTMDVTASSSTDYTFSGAYTGADPDITAEVGDTLVFNVNSPSHPFWIKTDPVTGTASAVSVANNGTGNGTISWVPDTPGTYYYICQFHSGMVGTITINASSTNITWNNGVTDGVPFTPLSSGYYTATATTGSCAVLDSLYVTLLEPTTSSITEVNCDNYTAPDGQTYTSTGNYTAVIPNAEGCDSTINIDLTITNSNSSSETVTECDSYTWATNGQTYTQSGQYTEVLPNQDGCDSTITLNLTIETVDITTQPMDQNVVVGNNAQFTVVTSASNPTYQWQVDDGTGWSNLSNAGQFSGTDTDVLTISNVQLNQNNFMYRCVVTSGNCETISSVARLTIQDNVGLEDLTKQGFTVFPNPTTNSFTITSEKVINSNFRLMDGQGREVLTGTINGQEHTMDISILSKGVYSVVFEQQDLPVLSVVKE